MRKCIVQHFDRGQVEIISDRWAGIELDLAAGEGAERDFNIPKYGLNLTFRSQERSRSRAGSGSTLERFLVRGAVFLASGPDRCWVENPAPFNGLNIHFDPARLAAYAERNGLRTPNFRPVAFEEDPRLHDIGRLIADEMRTPGGAALYRETLMHLAMAHLISAYTPDQARPSSGRLNGARLLAVCEYIEDNLAGRLTLDRLASVAAMSTFHFARSFRLATGLPPHRYVVVRRLERAGRLLRETALPVSSIAFHVGYADPSHFVRAFRQAHGLTPGEARRARG